VPSTNGSGSTAAHSGLAERYRDNLIFALRARNVPGEKIGQIVAEVEAHVAESGEDPVEAFGRPRDYAREWARTTGRRSSWQERVRSLVGITLSGVGGALFGVGLIRTATGETMWGGSAVLGGLVGFVLIAVAAAILRRNLVIDPRTGLEAERLRRQMRRGVLMVGTAVVLFIAAASVIAVTTG
jgi:hypothetical protein